MRRDVWGMTTNPPRCPECGSVVRPQDAWCWKCSEPLEGERIPLHWPPKSEPDKEPKR